jgi:protein gp37
MEFIDQVFGAMEAAPNTVFQVLTKRPGPMRRYITNRYQGGAAPRHIWFGTSVEDNTVAKRLDIIRRMKDETGCVTFASAEPIIGDCSKLSFCGIDWVLIGGESGHHARPMLAEWARQCRDQGREARAAIWFKQWGHRRNNPLVNESSLSVSEAWNAAVASGAELLPDEKGGATLDGETLRELPDVYREITASLRTV